MTKDKVDKGVPINITFTKEAVKNINELQSFIDFISQVDLLSTKLLTYLLSKQNEISNMKNILPEVINDDTSLEKYNKIIENFEMISLFATTLERECSVAVRLLRGQK